MKLRSMFQSISVQQSFSLVKYGKFWLREMTISILKKAGKKPTWNHEPRLRNDIYIYTCINIIYNYIILLYYMILYYILVYIGDDEG